MAQMNITKLILAIGMDMNIIPGGKESEEHYAERVILSAGAKWMLTAANNEEGKTSVDAVKSIVREKTDSYLEIIGSQLPINGQSIADIIYDTLLANGMFYHEQYYVRPVQHREIGINTVSFIRGLLPGEKASFSGMAPFIPRRGNALLEDEFMLWQKNGPETIQSAWYHSSPQDSNTQIGEYLRADHQMYQKYYDTKRYDHAEITLGRTRRTDSFGFDYYLIRGNEIRRLTDDYINASIHAYTAIAIVNSQRRQTVNARIGKDLVDLEMGYLLPKPDDRFMRFVSWPENLQTITKPGYRYALHPCIWPVIRDRLSFLGFAVEEQNE